MTSFYTRLAAGAEPARALRDAKLALLRRGAWAHPYHWASYFLVGSTR